MNTPEALQQLSDFAVATVCEGHTLAKDLVPVMLQEAARRGLVWHWEHVTILGTPGLQLRTRRTRWDLVVPPSPGGHEWDRRKK